MRMIPAMMLNLSLLALVSCGDLVTHAQAASQGWVTAGANPQRTSWVPDAAPGAMKPVWVKPVEPYISQKVQIVAASGRLFLSTARGLYAFDARTGTDLWVYATELPLGHSPTYASGRVYVGGLDRKIHAIDADTGQGLWTFSAAGGFHTCPLVVEGLVYAGSRSLPASNTSGQSGFWPGDEPVGISAGGSYIYWNLCNDRFIGSADLSVANAAFPETDGRRQWRYMTGDGFKTSTLPAGYNSQVSQYLWSVGPAKVKPMYWAHGDNVGPAIYDGRMYVHRGNAIIAFSPDGLGSSAPVLPVARIRSEGMVPEPLSETVLRERLATEVKRILDQGHLMAGFAKIGLIDFHTVNRLGDYLLNYWHNPADMLVTLLRALPHLPPETQDQARQYLRDEYAAFPPYRYVHIGFTDGAPRELFAYPPSTPRIFEHDFGPLTGSSFPGWSRPPHNVYAMWKYAQAGLADPATVLDQASGIIGSTPSDSYLQAFPHVHNAYIAGYVGYVELAKMASRPYATQQQELDRLLRLRAQTFRWDVQADTGGAQSDQYFYTLITAWNFMYLVPELADYLRQNALAKVQDAIDRYTHMAPYWMAGHNEEVQHENGITPLHQTHALFQAKAQILQASRDELAKVLDTPVVPAGDLFYLQNLISTLEASPTSSAGEESGQTEIE